MDIAQSPSDTFDAPTPANLPAQPDESSEWGPAPQPAEDAASPDFSLAPDADVPFESPSESATETNQPTPSLQAQANSILLHFVANVHASLVYAESSRLVSMASTFVLTYKRVFVVQFKSKAD